MISNLTVPVLNRYDLLRRLLSSIDYPIEHLLIIDNGGELRDLEQPATVERMTVLNMPSNLGVASSWNLGIKSFPYAPVWFFSSADMVYLPGALEKLAEAKPDQISLCADFPNWQTFAIGEEVIKSIGLFDESLHPIYFEDNEFIYRAMVAGIETVALELPVQHDNSAELRSNNHYQRRNSQSFESNKNYFDEKIRRADTSAGQWDLERRRANGWEE